MSTRPRKPAAALVRRLHDAGRELSTATVMFHTALALRRGLSATEEKALDLLLREGPMTHAELVERSGLAAASVSDLIDRLERKGYAHRERHPEDGRRILVRADAARIEADLTPLFRGWVHDLERLYASYSSDELEVIADFMTKAAARQRDAAVALDETKSSATPSNARRG